MMFLKKWVCFFAYINGPLVCQNQVRSKTAVCLFENDNDLSFFLKLDLSQTWSQLLEETFF